MRPGPTWIEPALVEMERRGVPVGIAGRHRVDRVLAHGKAWSQEALKSAMAALFARSAEERAAVREAVALFAPVEEKAKPPARAAVQPVVREPPALAAPVVGEQAAPTADAGAERPVLGAVDAADTASRGPAVQPNQQAEDRGQGSNGTRRRPLRWIAAAVLAGLGIAGAIAILRTGLESGRGGLDRGVAPADVQPPLPDAELVADALAPAVETSAPGAPAPGTAAVASRNAAEPVASRNAAPPQIPKPSQPAPSPLRPDDFCPPAGELRPLGTYRVPLIANADDTTVIALPRTVAYHQATGRSSPWPGLALGAFALTAAAALASRVRRRIELPRPVPPPIQGGDPIFALPARPLSSPLLTADERDRLGWGAGRYVSELEGDTLDLPASANATVRSGGVPTPRFHRRRLERAVWILEDTDPGDRLVAPLAAEILGELRATGVPCRHLRFDGVPAWIEDERGEILRLDDLEDDARHAAIAVLTGGAELSGRDGRAAPEAIAALRQIGRWPRVCVVDVGRGRSDMGRLLRALGIKRVAPEHLPAWLEDPERDVATPAPPDQDALARWAMLCALCPLEATLQDAAALLAAWQRERRDGAGLRALHLPDLLRLSVRADRMVIAQVERAQALQQLQEGALGLLAWASAWWAAQLKKEAEARQARQGEWMTSAAGQSYAAALVALRIERGERKALEELHALRQGGMRGWIDAFLERKALRGEVKNEAQEELPFGRDALMSREQVMLAPTKVGRLRPLPRELWVPATGAAACALLAGTGLAGLVDGARRWELANPAPVLVPAAAPIVVQMPVPTLEMVEVPGGTFCMGSPEDENERDVNESPRHLVRLDPFAMARTETTVGQLRGWLAQGGTGKEPSLGDADEDLPAVNVTWDEALAFCRHYGLDLPTEAQWEYAARAGTTTRFSFGNDDSGLTRVGWYDGNAGGNAHPVAGKLPNSLGLYDMHGNAFEWVKDWYATYQVANAREAVPNPTGPSEFPPFGRRVLRGGSLFSVPGWLRSALRLTSRPDDQLADVGFRCASAIRREH